MADDKIATIHQLHQPRRPKTDAERAKAYRDRKRAAAGLPVPAVIAPRAAPIPAPAPPAPVVRHVTPVSIVTAPSRRPGSYLLAGAALGLGCVGITMNGWFARSLGASDVAGWLFLAVGVAADLVALAVPSVAARQWQARRAGTAATAWLVWAMTFAFAVMAGIGFASLNISDVTASRASRITPAVLSAQTALADATAARDRECKGGVGKFCRERETVVADRQKAVDAAMHEVGATADPQAEAAIHIVTWLSRGMLQPSGNDFAMLRLILLALLPQIGGILLMIGRR